jgi:hypothetical protein
MFRLTIVAATLVAVMLGGCVTPTTIVVDRKVIKDGNVIEDTHFEGTASARNAESMFLKWGDVVTLQTGNTVIVEPDYEVISETLLGIMCAKNPLTCKDN